MCPFKPKSCILNYAKEKKVVSYASRGCCGITGKLEYVVPKPIYLIFQETKEIILIVTLK